MADGLHYLHSCKIIHGNLKGVSRFNLLSPLFSASGANLNELKANVMIDSNGHARLTDFGLTSIPRDEGSILSFQDSDAVSMTTWAAPEVLNGGAPSEKADVFTFAMVAVEVCTWVFLMGISRLTISKSRSQGVHRSLRTTKPPCLISCPEGALSDRRR